MALKLMLIAGVAMVALASPVSVAPASAHDYRDGHYYECDDDDYCYDDQWRETRELNLLQLENPGAGVYAVPGYDGPGYDDDHYDHDRYDRDDPYADDDDDNDDDGDD